MEKIYGEEVAVESAVTEYDVKSSIANFSDSFDDVSEQEINIELLKACILSDRPKDSIIKYINFAIETGRIEQIIMDMQINLLLRRTLVENYVRNVYRTTQQMYDKYKSFPESITLEDRFAKLQEYQKKCTSPLIKQDKKIKAKTYQEIKEGITTPATE
jgi:hypothetical protein